MKKKAPVKQRTRADVHRACIRRAKKAFRFLVDDFGFRVPRRPRNTPPQALGGREASFQYHKPDQITVEIVVEGMYPSVLLQGGRGDGWRARGLHQVMKLRCPDMAIPPVREEADQMAVFEFCGQVLREHFEDFLVGDSSILYEELPQDKR